MIMCWQKLVQDYNIKRPDNREKDKFQKCD